MLAPETILEIATQVRGGFYDKRQLLDIFCEEMYAPGELDPVDVAAAIDAESADWESEKASWPSVTDCDRLESAFSSIAQRGVIALQNAGYTQSDGYDDFRDAYETHPAKSSVLGYCYYHGQDVERAIHGSGLSISFGPADAQQEETRGPEVGRIVCEELERAGFSVAWDGTFNKRICIPDFVWQKR